MPTQNLIKQKQKMTNKIDNFLEYDEMLSSGAQPNSEQIIELKENGFEAIVSISPVSTRNYLPEEAELTESLSMNFVHFPIDCSNLKPVHYTTFNGIMKGLEGKKTFVHCGGNIKSSNLIHMYNVLEKGNDELESASVLQKVQQPEEKWLKYFKAFGMKGILN